MLPPDYPDEVTLGDPRSPVGLVTLWTPQARILAAVPAHLYAACGNLYSYWGIGLLVRSMLARPTLRYLVVCGVDYADTGRALVALAVEGLAADGTLPGTDTRLDADLDAAAITRWREQVTVVDLRGCTDAARVAAAIQNLPPPVPHPVEGRAEVGRVIVPEGWAPPPLEGGPRAAPAPGAPSAGDPPAAAVASATNVAPAGMPSHPPAAGNPSRAARGDAPPAEVAAPRAAGPALGSGTASPGSAAPWEPDPLGNFLIAVGGGQIVAAHATTTGGPTGHRFSGKRAVDLYRAILAAGLVSRLDHAAYLGAELAYAEVALRLGLPYRQDRPLRLPTEPPSG